MLFQYITTWFQGTTRAKLKILPGIEDATTMYKQNCLKKIAYSIRTKFYLKKNGTVDSMNYIKQLYIKKKNWNPPPAPASIKNKSLFLKNS
jgi:hypothetical protein